MRRFRRSQELPVGAEEAYAWHARPGAFERLVAPWERVEIEGERPGLEEGSRLAFRLRQAGIALRWVAEHRDVRPGREFSDVQIEGPFRHWRHRHAFEALGPDRCRLRDEIELELPLAPVFGWVAGHSVEAKLRRAFAYRHRVTARDLERHRESTRALTVAITGASGLIGSALTAFLESGGHRVIRLVRGRPGGRDERHWSVDEGADPQIWSGVDALVHLAGENLAQRWTPAAKGRIRSSRVEGTARLVESLKAASERPSVAVMTSAVGFYGVDQAEPATESSPSGEGFLAEVCREWEASARPLEALGIRTVWPRLGVVLTPAGGALEQLLPPFRLGVGGPIGHGAMKMPWIALDDVLYAIHHLLFHDELAGAFNLVAPETVENRDFARALGRALRRPALIPVPPLALQLAFGEMAEETILASQWVEPERLTEAGFRFSYPGIDVALRHLLGRETV